MPGFGRRHAPDPQDRKYPMRLLLDPLRERFFPRGLPEGIRHYRPGPVLNQRETGTCVAHAGVGKLNAAPIMQISPWTAFDLYKKVVLVDEWADNDFEADLPIEDLQFGTSVRALMKVLQKEKYIANYLWAESVEDIRAWHLAGFGGLVLGITWTSDMMNIDRDGYISFTGNILGGHAIQTTGWSDRDERNGKITRACRIQNSWDKEWGEGGRAWISEEDLARLLADQGEAAAATEIRVKPIG